MVENWLLSSVMRYILTFLAVQINRIVDIEMKTNRRSYIGCLCIMMVSHNSMHCVTSEDIDFLKNEVGQLPSNSTRNVRARSRIFFFYFSWKTRSDFNGTGPRVTQPGHSISPNDKRYGSLDPHWCSRFTMRLSRIQRLQIASEDCARRHTA